MTILKAGKPELSPTEPETLIETAAPVHRSSRGVWAWALVATLLLGASAGVRVFQERRFAEELGYLEDCPFTLATIPTTIGAWRLVDGGDQPLDRDTIKITGSTQHIQRVYIDELTGVTLGMLFLFGPAEPVLPHTPQVCYPATGHTELEEPSDRVVKGEDGKSYRFRTAVYGKSVGRSMLRSEVYHSYRLEGFWSPDAGTGRKFPRKNPGVFKVQVHRMIVAGERRDRDNPIDQFLGVLMPEIERRIAESQSQTSPGHSPVSKSSTPAL